MDLQEVFQKHRRLLLFAQLVGGDSLDDRIRNLSWILQLIDAEDTSWQPEELVVLAEDSTPFVPAKHILQEITKLKLLDFDSDAGVYNLNGSPDFHENVSLVAVRAEDCKFLLAELRDVLQGVSARRMTWTQSSLTAILHDAVAFGFHCIRSWQSSLIDGKASEGVPFLWNISADGDTTPMAELPASSATLDIVRLAVEPLNFLGVMPTGEQRSLVQWAFDQIYRNTTFIDDSRAYYALPSDDSYPNAVHPVNDSQARVIHLLVHLLNQKQGYLDNIRRSQARESVRGLAHYLLSEQLLTPGEKYKGLWSFHKYGDRRLDGFQVLTINSELAVKALETLWPIAEADLRAKIIDGITAVVEALRRSAIKDADGIGWQKHFSTLSGEAGEGDGANRDSLAQRGTCEVFATARAMLIFATATAMGICDDAPEYVRGALRFLEKNWIVRSMVPEDDIEFIPYRTPERSKWSDVTYRITNPISAVVPYCLLKASRLTAIYLPMLLTERVNNCTNFALENYGGHGFWLDAPTGLAYPTNTAFNVEMLMEYLRACEV